MKKVLLAVFLFYITPLQSQISPQFKKVEKYSVRQLKAWLKSQNRPRFVIPGQLDIMVEAAPRWAYVHEKLGGQNQVGPGTPFSNFDYKIDSNMQVNYKKGRTFAQTKLSFNNAAGLLSGQSSSIELSRASIGYHFVTSGPFTFDTIVGRRGLDLMYNSKLQFKGFMDGITGNGGYGIPKIGEARVTGGFYMRRNHKLGIVATRIYNIADTSAYYNYTLAGWSGLPGDAIKDLVRWKFVTSQHLVGWDTNIFKNNFQVFGAVIINHGAKKTFLTRGSKQNLAGYTGFQFGRTAKKHDFAFQGQLQLCQAQAIPDWDMNGIGRGNKNKGALYKANNIREVNGNGNFMGYEMQLSYAVSDFVTSKFKIQRSVSLTDKIGLPASYTTVKIDLAANF
jgi:hypothetical protein